MHTLGEVQKKEKKCFELSPFININEGVEEFFPHPPLCCFKVSCELSLLINLKEGVEVQLP